MLFKVLKLTLLATAACAATIPNTQPFTNIRSRAAGETAADILAEIAPKSKVCASTNAECRTNVQAAPYLIQSFIDYSITDVHEMAAVLSLIALESVEFQYNTNQAGTPGQGTRNMQMVSFNYEYASTFPELKSQLGQIATSASALTTNDQKNKVRALVLDDKYAWGTGAWFLTTKCASYRQGLKTGGQAGYTAYISQCVGTPITDQRLAYWTAANKAFGIAS